MRHLTLLFLLFSLCHISYAQEEPSYTISTDRSSVGFSSSIVPAKILQLETGFYTAKLSDNIGGYRTFGLSTLRYGLGSSTELRLDWGGYGSYTNGNGESIASGLEPLALGLKQRLLQSERQEISLVGSISIPATASEEIRPNDPSYYLMALFSHQAGKLSPYANLGYQSFGGSSEFIGVLGSGISLGDRFGGFAESVFISGDGTYRWIINAGLVYLINDKHQLDLTLGTTQYESSLSDSFLHLGWSTYFGK